MPTTRPATRRPGAQPARRRAAVSPRKVRIRTYRHGLGDCHLLQFAKPNGANFNLLIDCGVVDKTVNPKAMMTAVAQDIARETSTGHGAKAKPVLDLVIATHQHTDHLSGFEQARKEFDQMEFKRLWLAWTEDSGNPLGKRIKGELVRAVAAVRAAAARLTGLNSPTATRVEGILGFAGTLGVKGEETQAILDYLQERKDAEISYRRPGETFLLPEVPNVRVYVLGPPESAAAMRVTNPRKSKHEGYEGAALAAGTAGFIDAMLEGSEGGTDEAKPPFAASFCLDEASAREDPYFQKYYGFGEEASGTGEKWRRVDDAWLESAEQLALAVNSYINNTSLALAFEFIDTGEVLLFPGDAQVGSWLTWQDLTWTVKDGAGTAVKVKINDLFARTVFYKASHHASHNGTLSGLGLECMTHRNLVCVVPVDKAMSKTKHWDRTLPWQPLLNRLEEVTRGRLILTDVTEQPPLSASLKNLTPAERKKFERQFSIQALTVDYEL